ncbi:DNA-directed RNA polymerase subunit alpha [Synechococcus elongatus]|uniref:DNA-directed RNA polymerase subunit alpha n=2 Tax=Synechococcus elongatus TaxID=32046 RepID=A0AAN1QMT3_SYNEL|nr:DNA-directed RNA polymerase subunit alpha [Synechococcus elongatus]AZB72050.1 DNA-directed RNA polymerase subunit alpha [Synechococcus elongatus PCC 11801]QFZ91730.1 DNA-directed RNA polymerase subunit alpha [Synechococcus elongatus PCC 11802]
MTFQVECVESRTEADQGQYGRFSIEPLARGQGTTVGNALRRVLLSNLEGTAVTAVRIGGVNHEFATIPGVREDVLDILLNVRELVVHAHSPQPQIGRLRVVGPATVTAADVDFGPEVEVINPNHYIASLSEGATLEMELKVEWGTGYRAIDRSHDETTALDFLQLDAVFMPVRRVNYSVEDARVGESTAIDRLVLEVWTNGSISPQEALSQAASCLVALFEPLKNVSVGSTHTVDPEPTPESQTPIEDLQLSVRAYNCLKRAQVNSVADLLSYTYEDLLEIKNFGQKSAEEVVEALERIGIKLQESKVS